MMNVGMIKVVSVLHMLKKKFNCPLTFIVTLEGITLPYSHEDFEEFSFLSNPNFCYKTALTNMF